MNIFFFFGCVLERREGGEGEKGDVIRWGRTFSLGLFEFMVIVLHYRLRTGFKEKKRPDVFLYSSALPKNRD